MKSSSRKIAIVSLGCDKNRVDTENMLFGLSQCDFAVTSDFAEADIIIVNTCAFIESARQEAIETLLEMAEYKSVGKCKTLVATGCLPQKYMDELKDGLPEVDIFLGIDEYDKLPALLSGIEKEYDISGRILTTPPHYAYLKIADGCDNHCTFCTIPSIRGKYRSKTIETLIGEAEDLSSKGVSELILVAQDVTSYGKDIYGEPRLIELIKRLSQLDFKWIRLMYCYPELVSDELISEIANNPKVAKYIDIPMQHVADSVLKRMNRRNNGNDLRRLCEKLQNAGIAVRTTFMVGFPGETEEDFNELVDFLKTYPMRNVGIFAYSKEEGTPSAKLKGHLTKAVKKKRVDILGKVNYEQVLIDNARFVGQTVEVVYEDIDYDRNMFKGRMQYDAPEIDRAVYFSGDFADVGNFYKVRIVGYDGYDLIGEIQE